MMAQSDINWQPLSEIPTIAWMIDGMAESAEEQLPNLREAATKPHIMDNATIDRVLKVYGEQKADLWLYAEQLQRWRNQSPTPAQSAEITRLEQRLAALRTAIDELLALAQQIRPHTIDAILAKSDVELGLDVLLGRLRPPQ